VICSIWLLRKSNCKQKMIRKRNIIHFLKRSTKEKMIRRTMNINLYWISKNNRIEKEDIIWHFLLPKTTNIISNSLNTRKSRIRYYGVTLILKNLLKCEISIIIYIFTFHPNFQIFFSVDMCLIDS